MNLPIMKDLESEIVFKNLNQIHSKNKDMYGIIIKNSIISECIFEKNNMNNCDLLSSRIGSVKFVDVTFNSADIFSSWFSNCEFVNVDFSGASVEDITFVDCIFDNCIFNNTNFKNSIFNCTIFKHMEPVSCVFSLNTYNNCSFNSCSYRGSFQYQIFNNCKYDNVLMDSSLLKYNFGLKNAIGIQYYYQNQIIQEFQELKHLLINDCYKHNLFVNAVLVSYNFDEINPELAIKIFMALKKMLSNDILLRNDELVFLKSLSHFLYIQRLIAPIVIYKMFESIKEIYSNSIDNTAFLKCRESLNMIANSLYFDFSDYCNELRDSIEEMPNYSAPINIVIHYHNKPEIALTSILNQFSPELFKCISTKHGSFIEFLEAGQNGLEILKIFIQLLGISVPIIYSEIKEKRKKEPPIQIQENMKITTAIQYPDKNISELIDQTCQMINNSNILNKNLQGYNEKNIKEIKIEYHIEIQA